ncbi:MAG: hypothetical protein CL912_09465 [Deltaproteobacteria bacterium]|nr:hypothetical protein [Deltaproteobacteria bacterium]|tara:strand:- start:194 stop:688 length:495 start_codon:yes stop_codon:yes gene_type:complete
MVYKSRAKVPAILQTSKEARATGLKYYTLEFGNKTTCYDDGTTMEFTSSARIYANWEYDIICPVMDRHPSLTGVEDFEGFEDFINFDTSIRYKFMDPAVFSRMRRIAFVVDESCDVGWPDMSKRENIEVILYPDFEALMPLKEDVSGARKQLHMELVDLDENLD